MKQNCGGKKENCGKKSPKGRNELKRPNLREELFFCAFSEKTTAEDWLFIFFPAFFFGFFFSERGRPTRGFFLTRPPGLLTLGGPRRGTQFPIHSGRTALSDGVKTCGDCNGPTVPDAHGRDQGSFAADLKTVLPIDADTCESRR